MNLYIASKSGNPRLAMKAGNIVATCSAACTDSLGDARSYAIDHTKATDEPTWIYRVEIEVLGNFSIEKAVTYRPAK